MCQAPAAVAKSAHRHFGVALFDDQTLKDSEPTKDRKKDKVANSDNLYYGWSDEDDDEIVENGTPPNSRMQTLR